MHGGKDGGNYTGSQEYNMNLSLDDDNDDRSLIPSSSSQNDKMPPPPPPPGRKGGKKAPTKLRFDIFVKHYKKVPIVIPCLDDPLSQEETSEYHAYCNYCTKVYQFLAGEGYDTLYRHLKTKHPVVYGHTSTQTQLNFPLGGSDSSQSSRFIFKSDLKNHTEAITKWKI